MAQTHTDPQRSALLEALAAPTSSVRLRAALAVGSDPRPGDLEVLVQRCAVEPDFYVRDMLTWALTRGERGAVTARVLRELESALPQARSQALHTLSKLGVTDTAGAVTTELLQDAADEVARTAWRTAVALAPQAQQPALAEVLTTQLGRGDRDLQLSLSRALVSLGAGAEPAIQRAKQHSDDAVATHAIATEQLMADPEQGFDAAIDEAKRTVALLAAPRIEP